MDINKIKNTKTSNLPYSKANYQIIEQERNLLKITLDYVVQRMIN